MCLTVTMDNNTPQTAAQKDANRLRALARLEARLRAVQGFDTPLVAKEETEQLL